MPKNITCPFEVKTVESTCAKPILYSNARLNFPPDTIDYYTLI